MSFYSWVAQVQEIARSRNLILTTTYANSPSGSLWASFNWRAANGSRFGSSGAGEEFIGLTTPAQFTWDWYGLADPVLYEVPVYDHHQTPVYTPVLPLPPVSPNPWERRGRFIPRVPAMAVSDALKALFGVS